MSNSNISYRHFKLNSGNILTIASTIKYTNYPYDRIISYGVTIFDKRDKNFTKKYGNLLSKTRLDNEQMTISIFQSMENTIINHSLISLRIIDHMLTVLDDFKNHLEVYPCYFLQLCRSTTIEKDLEYLQSQLKDKILLQVVENL